MPVFSYKGINGAGKQVSGIQDADSAKALRTIPVMLDMGESEDNAGSFQAFVTWPTDMFAFVSVSSGTGGTGGSGGGTPGA